MHAGLPFLNSGIGDNYDIVESENVGINISKNNIDDTVNIILKLTGDKLQNMHENCIRYYVQKFTNQDMDGIFREIIQF
jgi:hypothetical protein